MGIADSHFLVGDYEKAAELAKEAEKEPKQSISRDIMHKINSYKAKNASMYRQSGGKRPVPVATVATFKPTDTHEKHEDYERLCNDKNKALNYTAPSAFCHIRNSGNYYSWAKEEVFLRDPFVAIIHDVISDKELEIFKRSGKYIILQRPTAKHATFLSNLEDGHPTQVGSDICTACVPTFSVYSICWHIWQAYS